MTAAEIILLEREVERLRAVNGRLTAVTRDLRAENARIRKERDEARGAADWLRDRLDEEQQP